MTSYPLVCITCMETCETPNDMSESEEGSELSSQPLCCLLLFVLVIRDGARLFIVVCCVFFCQSRPRKAQTY